jgi:hypothetical protein
MVQGVPTNHLVQKCARNFAIFSNHRKVEKELLPLDFRRQKLREKYTNSVSNSGDSFTENCINVENSALEMIRVKSS